ncbi:MAG: hypothetical protein M5U28_43830 [Sandaracinaceae bacterium]|nr:hypothetical protein [Sandaracinaceae bacterium]
MGRPLARPRAGGGDGVDPSSLDGAPQRAAFYDSGSEREKPLLVVLHSWSATYLQNIAIPYARFAIENDWVFVHPDFRGEIGGPRRPTRSSRCRT